MSKRKKQKLSKEAKLVIAAGGIVLGAMSYHSPAANADMAAPEGKHFRADAHAEPSSKPKVNFGPLSSKYDALFAKEGSEHGVSPILLASVAKAESNFNPNARSHVGARGLMQIMPGTAKGLKVNPDDPAQAVDGAARMLAGLEKQFGSKRLAAAAYNAGPGAVQKHKGVPPYVETQKYVTKVMYNYASAGGK